MRYYLSVAFFFVVHIICNVINIKEKYECREEI